MRDIYKMFGIERKKSEDPAADATDGRERPPEEMAAIVATFGPTEFASFCRLVQTTIMQKFVKNNPERNEQDAWINVAGAFGGVVADTNLFYGTDVIVEKGHWPYVRLAHEISSLDVTKFIGFLRVLSAHLPEGEDHDWAAKFDQPLQQQRIARIRPNFVRALRGGLSNLPSQS